ncbi:OmpA family protein [Humitalea rosea]|uniref:OmpA family protein n=1 Tax=Humitalea rosea TaxID=990373 RepID=A0A2W7I2B3_9PROT|nr:OmpA family protein [Humitalea rosea]PZW41071.1 OmpA family protein [Humitalea rosea]
MMHRLLAPLLLLPLLAVPALAQPRSFSCIGAERLEDDVFEVAFRAGHADPQPEAMRTPLAAALAVAREDPSRNICVLGYARQEGGQTTGTQLAARRARAVALALSGDGGIERDRIRAEARNAGFSRRAAASQARRAVVIVVLPAPVGAAPPVRPAPLPPTRLTPVTPTPAAPPVPAPATPAAPAPPAEAPDPPAPPHPPAPSPAPDPAPPSR